MNPSIDPLPLGAAPAPDLMRRYTSIEVPQRLHLESLMATWSLLADLSFSDLLLFAPVTRDGGEAEELRLGFEAVGTEEASPEAPVPVAPPLPGLAPPPPLLGLGEAQVPMPSRPDVAVTANGPSLASTPGAFVVLGQIRPTTSQTLYEGDLVGQVQPVESLPNMVEALETGVIIRAEQPSAFADGLVRITHIPVRHRSKIIAVLCRIWSPWTARRRGTLERGLPRAV